MIYITYQKMVEPRVGRAIALSNQKSPPTQQCITQDLLYLKELIKAGKIRAVIDRTYPLQVLAAAHGYSVGVLWGKLPRHSQSHRAIAQREE